jgi:hypothetical protein
MRSLLDRVTVAAIVLACALPVAAYAQNQYQQNQYPQQGQYPQQNQYQQQGQYQQPNQFPQGPSNGAAGPMDITGGWSTEVSGPQGVTRAAAVYGNDGTFVTLMQLPNGSIQKIWGTYTATQVAPGQIQLNGQTQGWLPQQICAEAPGFPMRCQPYTVPPTQSVTVQFTSPSTIEADGALWNRDPSPALLQAQVPAQVVNNVPAPVQPIIPQPFDPNNPQPISPNNPVAGNPGCDDLQQERICTVNDGTIVMSGGCEKCLAP